MMNIFANTFYNLLLCWSIGIAYGAKILSVFPMPAKSHFSYNDAIMKSLIAAGHEVTVVSPFPHSKPPANYTVVDMSKDSFIYVGRTALSELNEINTYELIKFITTVEEEYCYKFMKQKEIQDLFNSNEKMYDVMFLEIFKMYKCFLPLAQKLNIPIIGTASQRSWLYADRAISNPNNPSYIPSEFGTSLKTDSFYDRLINVWKTAIVLFAQFYDISSKIQNFYQQYSKELSFFREDSVKPSLIFYNTHFSYFSRPMNPNAIEIAGIHIKKVKPLPENIKTFIEDSPNGVILFSLGSMIKGSSLSEKAQLAFKEAFAEIPQRVVWKYEEEMKNVPPNVLLSHWIPQRDILAHPNVKAFISHCGQAGTYEAIDTGTPLVTVSINGDQLSTAAHLQNLGVAMPLNIHVLSKQLVLEALNLIINNTKFLENMQRLSKSFKDRPMTPQQTVVYWTEYVIRHNGASHLQSSASHLSWFQYLLLDVILFIVFLLSIPIYLVYCVLQICHFQYTQEKIVKNPEHHGKREPCVLYDMVRLR